MTDEEWIETLVEKSDIYRGILSNNPNLPDVNENKITYDFSCPQFKTLKEKYNLEEIAGKGTAFERAVRMLRFFAPRLAHDGDFTNTVGCNALNLLDYALDNPTHAINCVNKSKILQECCLAIGIAILPAKTVYRCRLPKCGAILRKTAIVFLRNLFPCMTAFSPIYRRKAYILPSIMQKTCSIFT